MPLYCYSCQGCGQAVEEIQSYNDQPLRECPHCGFSLLQRVIGLPNTIVRYSPKTVGQLAEQNTRDLVSQYGRERAQEILHERTYGPPQEKPSLPGMKRVEKTNEVEIPWWRNSDTPGLETLEKPLDVTTVKDPQKYVITGDKT
jgi:putative FmdB family regulatory protein